MGLVMAWRRFLRLLIVHELVQSYAHGKAVAKYIIKYNSVQYDIYKFSGTFEKCYVLLNTYVT